MKKLLFIAALIAVSFVVKAQDNEVKPLKFSIGLDATLPIGDFGDLFSLGIGGSVQADYSVAEKLAITLNAGYMNYSGKTVGGFKIPSTGFVPVLGGIKYSFTEKVYGSAQLGMSFSTEDGGGSAFTYAPGVGYQFTPNFDALLKYTGMSDSGTTLNTIGLRVAYTF